MEIGVEFIVKILFSMLFGALIGVEREVTNKFAGLRTHILVSLGACVFTILSIHGFPVDTDRYNADPARIAAQVVTGIGFIGGGTVLRMGNNIYGITTAATLWLAASVGMACGAGFYWLGALCSLLALFTLVVIRFMEFKFFPKSAKTATKIKAQIFVKNEDVKKEAEDLAKKYQMDKDEFLKLFGGLEMVKYDLEMRKTIEFLKDNN